MWFVPPQAPRPHQWQCILTCNAESPEDFEYCLPTKGCYSVNRILSSLTLVWLDSTGVKSCSPTAWVFCSCKGLSSDKASTLLYRVWLSLEVCPSESESLLRLAMHMQKEWVRKLTHWEFLLAAYASLLHFTRSLKNKRFGRQISLNWPETDLWLAS